ncbi:GNAT family N-acetyltransferase [Amycolatopsis acidicola]|uniref:GNAT family N-acetyltransferase n=2 Tax=Amycolatopsis acidicola TaxID=2596893 RepID=A0A5N0URT5_9PSEU|nr:GNAT family N-acetyltransferase [Amycolatopsis acidicola]
MEFRELAGTTADRALLARVVLACSGASLGRRFFLGGTPDPLDVLDRYQRYLLAGPPEGAAVLALAGGVPAGLANLARRTPGEADLGLLVADPWQRQGIGTALAEGLWRSGRWPGWTVHASVLADNLPAKSLLRAQGFRAVPGAERGQDDYLLRLPATMTTVMREAEPCPDRRANGWCSAPRS